MGLVSLPPATNPLSLLPHSQLLCPALGYLGYPSPRAQGPLGGNWETVQGSCLSQDQASAPPAHCAKGTGPMLCPLQSRSKDFLN